MRVKESSKYKLIKSDKNTGAGHLFESSIKSKHEYDNADPTKKSVISETFENILNVSIPMDFE